MTVKELYDYAKNKGAENTEIFISYEANNSWEGFENAKVYEEEVSIYDYGIFIQL